jgi:hypothetical protein
MTTCPICNGHKTCFVHLNYGNSRPHEWKRVPCDFCGGEGEVSDELMARYTEGQRMREDRLARRASLREEAKRFGITPQELNAREHGR